MPAEVTRDEFRVIEREVEGEKMVTRHILEQTRRNDDDLAAIKSRLDRIELTVDRIDRRLDGGEKRVDGLESKIDGLIKTLPRIIGEAVRQAFDERDRRKT
jgi:archaellum component FlaC